MYVSMVFFRYKNFQEALVHRRARSVRSLDSLFDRSLYGLLRSDVELWTNWLVFRRWYGRAANEACWKKSLLKFFFFAIPFPGFFSLFAFLLLVYVALLRLRTWTLNVFIILCADSAMFVQRMSRIFALGTVFRAFLLFMLRSVTRASELTALARYHIKGRMTVCQFRPKYSRFRDRVAGRVA